MKALSISVVTILIFGTCTRPVFATSSTWQLSGGGSWNNAGNWDNGIPNASGDSATFNSTSDPNRTITNDSGATGFTVGSITYNSNSGTTQTTSLTTGTTGSKLILDNGGAGVTITTSGTGTGNMTISVPLTFNDSVTANVNQQNVSSAAHSLNLTSTITGSGGFTKSGDGGATFGTGAKNYTGPTNINGGRIRISQAARPQSTSSFTINNGGQVELITNGTYTFGTGTLNLNGAGPTTGQFAPFPGAIRPTRTAGANYTITNDVNLASDTVIHMQAVNNTGATANPDGSLTFSGNVGGIGKLTFTANNSDADQGFLILSGANNTFSGGTLVQGGIIKATSTNAFGAGNITVNNTNSPSSFARIDIAGSDTIKDTATLSLLGGGTAGSADVNYAILEAGVNETVGSLILGGVSQTAPGTYGATGSGATFIFDDFFSGSGVVTLAAPAGVPGDYNGNGVVDAADYVLWSNGGPLQNEVDNSGTVDANDYTAWRARFGNTSGAGSSLAASSAVPETTSAALLSLLVITALSAGRRRFVH